MRAIRTITPLFILILLPLAAGAQDDIAEEVEEIRRYTIEMIIFKYAQSVSSGSEIFPGDEPPRDGLFADDDVSPADIRPRVIRDVEFARLARDEYTMDEIMGRLRRLEAYNPIMHFGWTQITWPKEQTRPINLASLARPPQGLEGTLTLYLSRFLHLVVDLQLDAPRNASVDATRADRMAGPVRYRIQEDRILKTGDVRYFDHPKFGVLVKVSRVDDEQEELPGVDDTELTGDSAE
jgi:hypothetical protein